MSKPTRVITLKVPTPKLKAILDRPPARPDPLSCLNPHADTPATPVARASTRTRQITAGAVASASQGNSVYTGATFRASFSPEAPDRTHSSSAFPSSASRGRPNTVLEAPAADPPTDDDDDDDEDQDGDIKMTDKDNQKQSAGAAPANGEGGTPFYEEQRKFLSSLLEKKKQLEKSLVCQAPLPLPSHRNNILHTILNRAQHPMPSHTHHHPRARNH